MLNEKLCVVIKSGCCWQIRMQAVFLKTILHLCFLYSSGVFPVCSLNDLEK